jgi:hypothetical protein
MNSQEEAINTLLYHNYEPETFILQPLLNQIFSLMDSTHHQWFFTIRKRCGKLILLAKNSFMKHFEEIHSFKLR